jgi:hypothetical protein
MSSTDTNQTAPRQRSSLRVKAVSFDARSPAEAAKLSTRRAVASLHISQQQMIESYIDQIITLITTLSRYEDSKKRMEDAAFTPRALRFKFSLKPAKVLKDTVGFNALRQRSVDAITTCTTALKQTMIECKQLEILETNITLLNLIYKASAFYVYMTYKEHKKNTNELFRIFVRICRAVPIRELEHKIPEARRDTLLDGTCITKPDDYVAIPDDLLSDFETDIQTNILDMFISPKVVYQQAIDDNKHTLELKRLAKLTSAETKADEVTMLLDNEQSVDNVTLNKLINDTVNKKLQQHLNKLNARNNNNGNGNTTTRRNNQRSNRDHSIIAPEYASLLGSDDNNSISSRSNRSKSNNRNSRNNRGNNNSRNNNRQNKHTNSNGNRNNNNNNNNNNTSNTNNQPNRNNNRPPTIIRGTSNNNNGTRRDTNSNNNNINDNNINNNNNNTSNNNNITSQKNHRRGANTNSKASASLTKKTYNRNRDMSNDSADDRSSGSSKRKTDDSFESSRRKKRSGSNRKNVSQQK